MQFTALVGKYIGRPLEGHAKPAVRLCTPDSPVLARSPNDWPEGLLEFLDERAGIMEFDGGMPRGEAEWWAEQEIRGRFGYPPDLDAPIEPPREEC